MIASTASFLISVVSKLVDRDIPVVNVDSVIWDVVHRHIDPTCTFRKLQSRALVQISRFYRCVNNSCVDNVLLIRSWSCYYVYRYSWWSSTHFQIALWYTGTKGTIDKRLKHNGPLWLRQHSCTMYARPQPERCRVSPTPPAPATSAHPPYRRPPPPWPRAARPCGP